VAGAVCIPIGLSVRRFRPVAVAQAIALLDVLHGGYLPVPYVIGLLPFGALLIAGAGSTLRSLTGWPKDRRFRAALLAVVLLGGAGVVVANVAPAWAAGLRTEMTQDEMTPTARSEAWVEQHVPHTDRLLTDDTDWVDLVDHGFSRPLGVVWFYKLGYVNNLDPSVSRTLGGGWRDFQYVIVTPSMRAALAGSGSSALPQVAQAVRHSSPSATFGSGGDLIVVRHIHPTRTPHPTHTARK
jgi:hypothetical protein